MNLRNRLQDELFKLEYSDELMTELREALQVGESGTGWSLVEALGKLGASARVTLIDLVDRLLLEGEVDLDPIRSLIKAAGRDDEPDVCQRAVRIAARYSESWAREMVQGAVSRWGLEKILAALSSEEYEDYEGLSDALVSDWDSLKDLDRSLLEAWRWGQMKDALAKDIYGGKVIEEGLVGKMIEHNEFALLLKGVRLGAIEVSFIRLDQCPEEASKSQRKMFRKLKDHLEY